MVIFIFLFFRPDVLFFGLIWSENSELFVSAKIRCLDFIEYVKVDGDVYLFLF